MHPFLLQLLSMPKVVQIRGVPDEVHDALAGAATAEGLSLSRYVLRELEHLAARPATIRSNAGLVRETQAKVQGRVKRSAILEAIHESRDD